MTRKISLQNGMFAIVDEEDYMKEEFKWIKYMLNY